MRIGEESQTYPNLRLQRPQILETLLKKEVLDKCRGLDCGVAAGKP